MSTVSSSVVMAKCRNCGVEFNAKRSRGPLASYCTANCRNRAAAVRFRESGKYRESTKAASRAKSVKVWEKNLSMPALKCEWCGKDAPRGRAGKPLRFCDKKCRAKYDYSRHKEVAPRCSESGCDKPSHARGLCGSHYSAIWRTSNPDKYTAKNLRYRAQKRHQGAESFSRIEVMELSGWTCHLCGDPIDRDCAYPNPMYGTVDHVVPLAKGGTHTLDNVKAAHHVCNSTKRDSEKYAHVK